MIKEEGRMGPAARFYAAVSGEHLVKQSAPVRTAWLIERLASQRGWPAGEVLGSESELREQLGVGREALREAISILSNRGVVEVRRGRNGGVQVLSSDLTRTANAVAAYLRAIEGDPDQSSRCIAGFDWLLAYKLSRRDGPLPARRHGEAVRKWLARVCDHPVYLLYVEVIDALSAGGPGDATLPDELLDAISHQDAKAIVSSLGAMPSASPDPVDDTIAQSPQARAFTIAHTLLERAASSGERHLGNEVSLCEEHSASRSVIRQALRILQDLDVVHARLGRGGGYEFKRPRPIGVIRQVFAWLAACRLCPFELIELVWDHNATNVRLAASRLAILPDHERECHLRALDKVLEQSDDAQRFVNLQKRLGEIAASPLVDICARSIVSYQARYPRERPEPWAAISFLALERQIVSALRAGQPGVAEASIRAMQARLLEALQNETDAFTEARLRDKPDATAMIQ
ncbi:GntR family transcriptional regulator [Aurantiacibacter poecillastricola]|uniref:GntR family transcriptional regulator n=1 Tax=Aurantiacibacter poecillastricola TaxID=3064385 RepID=UPI00273D0607|nr:GntR family transcriptional regulator [Aurantiacibacter sp. 219JJ12-13]MDP5261239.1 GntR family transcriptional regulator [Aurantiacibacter sp. 219JJ12-13]